MMDIMCKYTLYDKLSSVSSSDISNPICEICPRYQVQLYKTWDMYDTPRQSPPSSCQLLYALGQLLHVIGQLLHGLGQLLHALDQLLYI
jgi:hypothetical protein